MLQVYYVWCGGTLTLVAVEHLVGTEYETALAQHVVAGRKNEGQIDDPCWKFV